MQLVERGVPPQAQHFLNKLSVTPSIKSGVLHWVSIHPEIKLVFNKGIKIY